MKIGIVIARIGGLDGVALETEKWIQVLKKKGHEIFLLSGEYKYYYENLKEKKHYEFFETLSFFSKECIEEQDLAFFKPQKNVEPLMEKLNSHSKRISDKILSWIKNNGLDLVISENLSCLPSHLSLAVGFKRATEILQIPVVCHNHDFEWERKGRYISPHQEINKLVKDTYPLRTDNVKNLVINSSQKRKLKRLFNLDSVVVPNVFDFNGEFASKRNMKLRDSLKLKTDDIILLQPTRIVPRKNIETAIELIYVIDDPKVKLVITGNAEDSLADYFEKLTDLVENRKLKDRVLFSKNHFCVLKTNQKKLNDHCFSLESVYYEAKSITYFSHYEGWGNALIETVAAKKPIFVNNYKPVFLEEIGNKNFQFVVLEDGKFTQETVSQMKEIIYDEKKCKEIGEYNYEIGKQFFSLQSLENIFDKEGLFL